MAELIGLGEVLQDVGQRDDRADDAHGWRIPAQGGEVLVGDGVGAFARGDFILKLVAQFVPVDAVGHGLKGAAQERVLGCVGFGFERQQAVFAGDVCKFDEPRNQAGDRRRFFRGRPREES